MKITTASVLLALCITFGPGAATALLDIEPRLKRIRGYRHLPLLREAIRRELGLVAQEAEEPAGKEVA